MSNKKTEEREIILEELYSYIFWYNPYEALWYAIERDSMLQFFSGNREKVKSHFHKSKEHSTLVQILTKKGVLEKLINS